MNIIKKLLYTILIFGVIWSVNFAQQDDKKPPKPPGPIIKIPSPKPTPTPKPTPKPNADGVTMGINESGK